MADVSLQQNNNVGCSCSPKPDPLISSNDDYQLSIMEQGKGTCPSQSQASPTVINPSSGSSSSVYPTNAHKIIAEKVGTYVIVVIVCGCWMMNQIYSLDIIESYESRMAHFLYLLRLQGEQLSLQHCVFATTLACWCIGLTVIGPRGASIHCITIGWLEPLLILIFHVQVNIDVTVTQFVDPTTVYEAFAREFILSFILMLTICGVAIDSRAV
ncbi:hypothetical protein QYF36_008697 [Acer negundo]|nr:hypothetical protein QYF36_008697 [Acer negundo]